MMSAPKSVENSSAPKPSRSRSCEVAAAVARPACCASTRRPALPEMASAFRNAATNARNARARPLTTRSSSALNSRGIEGPPLACRGSGGLEELEVGVLEAALTVVGERGQRSAEADGALEHDHLVG